VPVNYQFLPRVASAAQFAIPCDRGAIVRALHQHITGKSAPLRVRLVLSADGALDITSSPLAPMQHMRFAVSDERVSSADLLLRH